MTKIKLCGLMCPRDIQAANELQPDYIGFVFAKKSRRAVTPELAAGLKRELRPEIRAVGVFVREEPEVIAELLETGVIDMAQLHGGESTEYIGRLRELTDRPLIQAFRAGSREELERALTSEADAILLDSGSGGTGETFDWSLLPEIRRPWFLAGGLDEKNVAEAVRRWHPYAVDVSSGIETEGRKDAEKMRAFVRAVRAAEREEQER